jgi:predicted Zn-dependent protease
MPVEEQDTSKNHLQKAVAALKSIEREASQALLDLDPAPLNDVQVADDLRRLDRALVLQEELEFALNALSEAADSGHAIEGSVSAVVDLWQQVQASRAPKGGDR